MDSVFHLSYPPIKNYLNGLYNILKLNYYCDLCYNAITDTYTLV